MEAPKGTVYCGDCGQAYQGKEAKKKLQEACQEGAWQAAKGGQVNAEYM